MSRGTKTTVTFAVRGLTRGRCIAEVMEHVQVLPGVRGVAVALVIGTTGQPSLTADLPEGARS